MASSNYNTCDRIIRTALRDAALLQEGDDPSSEVIAEAMNRLNDLVNLWQTQGIKLWLNRTISVTPILGQATYTLPAAPSGYREMRALEGYFADANGITRPLELLTWNTYGSLPNKSQQGAITSFFIDKQLSTTLLSLWLTPDSQAVSGTVQLLVQDSISNHSNLTESMVFPVEWSLALHWGLADELCTGQPEPIVQRCAMRAKMYREALEAWDVEDGSISFQPNSDGPSSGFR